MVRLFCLLAVCGLLVLSPGCAKNVPLHPGAINSFDSQAWDALVTVQAGLNQARVSVSTDFPQFAPQFNQLTAAYNAAQAAYKLYHTAGDGAPTQAALQAQIDGLVQRLTALLASLGVKQ